MPILLAKVQQSLSKLRKLSGCHTDSSDHINRLIGFGGELIFGCPLILSSSRMGFSGSSLVTSLTSINSVKYELRSSNYLCYWGSNRITLEYVGQGIKVIPELKYFN